MMVDVDALLEPVAEDNPTGEDLDGTPERYAIEQAFEVDQSGDADTEVDWRGTVSQIERQFGESKDLWLGAYLMRAGAKLGDLNVVLGAARVLAGLVERYWDDVHPRLEMVDFVGRKAPFEALTKFRDFLGPLRDVVMVEHPRLGRYTAADLQTFASDGEAADNYGMFRAAIEDSADALQTAAGKITEIESAVRYMDGMLTFRADDDTSTNFEPTYEALAQLRRSIAAFVVADDEAEDGGLDLDLDIDVESIQRQYGAGDDLGLDLDLDGDDAPNTGSAAPVGTGARIRRASGKIESRADVIATLEAIEAYYRISEPSSPVPALLKRARGWVDKDFMALLEDLTPDSMSEARKVFGIKSEGYGESY